MLPFFKPKKGFQLAGSGGGGSIDTSALANKTALTAIILTGTTNTSGDVISAGTWFYLNGKPCITKVDIASGATFTEGTNYEEKTIGSALSELNSKIKTKNLSGTTDTDGMLYTGLPTTNSVLIGFRPTVGDMGGNGFNYYFSISGVNQYITFTLDSSVSTKIENTKVTGVLYYIEI